MFPPIRMTAKASPGSQENRLLYLRFEFLGIAMIIVIPAVKLHASAERQGFHRRARWILQAYAAVILVDSLVERCQEGETVTPGQPLVMQG